jgi:hypothetical protein
MRRSRVAREVRAEQAAEAKSRSAEENVREALALGEAAVALLTEHQGLSRDEAHRVLRSRRQLGRRRSRAALE